MKKTIMICLLALMSAGGVSCIYAQTNNDSSSVSTSAASPSIRNLCEGIDMIIAKYKENPKDLQSIGEGIDKKTSELDPNLKLNDADKALLRQSLRNMMEAVVTTQLTQNPLMAQKFASMTDEEKKEMLSMAMDIAMREVDSKIDACETLGDFGNIEL